MKQRDGCYKDALLNKKNEVQVILHETLGGGFSPPAVAALHANSKIARTGVDTTKYTCPRPISYITHHSQHISLGIVKADASAIRGDTVRKSSVFGSPRIHDGRLPRRRRLIEVSGACRRSERGPSR